MRSAFPDPDIDWVLQSEQLGTGHAVLQALPRVAADSEVLVLYGDVPLVRATTLRRLLDGARGGLALLTTELAQPDGYGRIVRDKAGRVVRIVEQKDASAAELALREINAGFFALPARRLSAWLAELKNDNAQKEYYLTDIVALAVAQGVAVNAISAEDHWEVAGVNSRQ